MGDVIVVSFTTLDGVVSDPDGRGGTPTGGWMFRFGQGPVDGDKFRLGERQEKGVQLYGRRTWEAFAKLWPNRDNDFAKVMNAVPKRVATRTDVDAGAWENSSAISGDLVSWVKQENRDIVVIGSLSVVDALAGAGLVDEYRLITFPIVVGEGERLGALDGFKAVEAFAQEGTVLTVLRKDGVSASR